MARRRAVVIGAGPNGLTAAAVLARAGLAVEVLEAQDHVGGACATGELTLPGFRHDLGSSAYPMGAASPAFRALGLEQYGLRWLKTEAPMAHVLDAAASTDANEDAEAVLLWQSLARTTDGLGRAAGRAYKELLRPLVDHWDELVPELLGPVVHVPRHPLLLGRFGAAAVLPATALGRMLFGSDAAGARGRALLAGLAGHAVLPLGRPVTSAIALVLAAAAHAVGWPVAAGGGQSISDALAACVREAGGVVRTGVRVRSLAEVGDPDLVLCDLTPRGLLAVAGEALTPSYRALLRRFQYGPGSFKIDWALRGPIPWRSLWARTATSVHVGGSMEEVEESESAPWQGRVDGRPFLIVVQPSVADPSRAPAEIEGERGHTAWGYCHVPNGWKGDATDAIESQMERFAPGFRARVLARRAWSTGALEAWNPNLPGGDVSGGAMTPWQMDMRPTPSLYRTSRPGLWICSSSTPPGGGVHGMGGWHAARAALRSLGLASAGA